jgi:hypothetical protein
MTQFSHAEIYCNGQQVRRERVKSNLVADTRQNIKRLNLEVSKAAYANPHNIYWIDLKIE